MLQVHCSSLFLREMLLISILNFYYRFSMIQVVFLGLTDLIIFYCSDISTQMILEKVLIDVLNKCSIVFNCF